MRDIYYDTEFLVVKQTRAVHPISIALVNERDEEYYGIFDDSRTITNAFKHPWLPDNVLKYLPIETVSWQPERGVSAWSWDEEHPDFQHVKPGYQIAREVFEFIWDNGAPGLPRLWAYFSAFDHVVLTGLWGDFTDMPDIIPRRTDCLAQEAASLGLRTKPPAPLDAHDARADARWNVTFHRLIKQRRQELGL